MGEEPVAVANKLVKQALVLKVDINFVYPITGVADAIYRIEEALEKLGSPASQGNQVSWFVQALKEPDSRLPRTLGRKAAHKAVKILNDCFTCQGAMVRLQDRETCGGDEVAQVEVLEETQWTRGCVFASEVASKRCAVAAIAAAVAAVHAADSASERLREASVSSCCGSLKFSTEKGS